MTIEFALKVFFFLQFGILVALYGRIWLKLKKSVREGDAYAVYSLTRGLLMSKSFRDKLVLKALENKEAKDLSVAKERRRDVIKLLSKIPGIEITRPGLEEDNVPSRG